MSDVLVWWRDDDAGRHDARLDRLLELAATDDRPLGLAVVPAWLDAATTARALAVPSVHVLQHGWAHADHAAAGAKSIELGGTLALDVLRDRLKAGASRLLAAFGERFLPVMVPPWNRIDTPGLAALAGLGFRALSTFAEDRRGRAHDLVQANTHVDLIDWQGTRRMKPEAALLGEIDRLMAQPDRRVLGLLSHHLEMSLDDMARLRQLLTHLDAHRRCRWADLPTLFSSH